MREGNIFTSICHSAQYALGRQNPTTPTTHPIAILVRMTLSAKIELIHFSDLSSRDPNCQDNIQLFLQQFEKFSMYCVTNWHYKVLGMKQTSEWHFTCLRSQCDSFSYNCNSINTNVSCICNRTRKWYLASFGVEFRSFLLLLYCPPVTVAINNSQPLVYTFIPHLFQILVSKMFPCKDITLISSFSNITIPSQRLVTTSASLHTQTRLHCLIIQVLNIKSLLPKWFSHFCT